MLHMICGAVKPPPPQVRLGKRWMIVIFRVGYLLILHDSIILDIIKITIIIITIITFIFNTFSSTSSISILFKIFPSNALLTVLIWYRKNSFRPSNIALL